MLYRIILAFVLFAALLVCEHMGMLKQLPALVLFIIYAVPYLVIGYDIIFKAFRNISHGQVFDENFLMMIATFGAFGVQEYSEAVAVMLLSGRRAVSRICSRQIKTVNHGAYGYLPGIRKYRRGWKARAG